MDARSALSSRCRALARRPRRLELKFSLLAAAFVGLDGPRRCGFPSQGQYAREALGMSGPQFTRRHRVGLFLLHCAAARAGLLAGHYGFSALELLLRKVGARSAPSLLHMLPGLSLAQLSRELDSLVDGGEVEVEPVASPEPDPGYRVLRLHAPESLARLLEKNQELSRLLAGADLDESGANALWIAEAASECAPADEVLAPWRLLGLPDPGVPRRTREREPAPEVDLPVPQPLRRHRQRAARLDHQLERLAGQMRRARAVLADQLLDLAERKVWVDLGYPTADEFAEEHLGLASRTYYQYLDDARRRRRDDPVARALAAGEIGGWTARRLDEFRRRAHVGHSGMPAWIDAARELSAKGLLRRIELARHWARFDARRWALEGWPVPTDEQLHAPERSVAALLEAPALPDEAGFLASRRVPVELELTEASYQELMAMWGAVHQRRRRFRPETHAWTSLLAILLQAHRGLLQQALGGSEPTRARILLRDGYRCQNPACGRRIELEGHHMDWLSRGGADEPWNILTLCHRCHRRGVHEGRLRVSGRSDDPSRPPRFELSIDEKGRALRVYSGERRVRTALGPLRRSTSTRPPDRRERPPAYASAR